MIDLGISADARAAFERTLATSHRMRVRVTILDRNENPVGDLAGKIVGGSVQVDSTATVSRSLSLDLIDDRRLVAFEPGSPADGAVYADNFLAVTYGVWVPDLASGVAEGDWVDVPVFSGPITHFERTGAEARLEAQGKESLLLEPHYALNGYTIRKGTRTDDAIKLVARRAGELKFNLPDLPNRLSGSRVVSSQSQPWLVIKGGEESAKGKLLPGLIDRGGADFEPYYNGRGALTARRRGGNSKFTFLEGVHLLGKPQVTNDVLASRNLVDVAGGRKKKRPRAHGRAALPPADPLSPQSLARNGAPRFLTEFVSVDGLKTNKACNKRAKEILARVASESVGAAFNSLVVPHLEEDDEITLRTDEFTVTFPVRQFTIPLTAEDSMSVGGTKAVGH